MINSLIKGRVINKIQGFYYVSDGTQEYECRLRGVLKRKDKKDNCVVGDYVEISEDNFIMNIAERKNIINRPLVDECRLRGVLKRKDKKDNCVVGDYVEISEDNFIMNIAERKNIINRPLVANIDYLVIQFAAKDPEIELDRLNNLILNSIYHKISPIVVINKIDLLSEDEKKELSEKLSYLKDIDIPLFFVLL